ncbi:hypothetical protein [Sinomicrobium pectinilyticum]|uniref:hypothetical protein n=1 Tax=Sinomicrobium pectinilyticum TaxID=1084421 RepID=UPI001476156C|nr:hypothetical protein [Sinomicrobium pectinilyticum]
MQSKFFKLWGIPIVLGIISLYALISALIGGVVADTIANILLFIPVFITIKNYYKSKY